MDTLVLGRYLGNSSEVDAHVEAMRGHRLRVYSQEMFLAYLGSDEDPYDDDDLLAEFRDGHPGLEHLLMWGFEWPKTDVVPPVNAGAPASSAPWPLLGLLKYMGYTVGSNGENVILRQKILRRVFIEQIPNVESPAYMDKWGTPGSAQRLKKLANTIAAFARNHKKKAEPSEGAIRDWEDDLAWLKATFYHGGFRFSWPRTHAQS